MEHKLKCHFLNYFHCWIGLGAKWDEFVPPKRQSSHVCHPRTMKIDHSNVRTCVYVCVWCLHWCLRTVHLGLASYIKLNYKFVASALWWRRPPVASSSGSGFCFLFSPWLLLLLLLLPPLTSLE